MRMEMELFNLNLRLKPILQEVEGKSRENHVPVVDPPLVKCEIISPRAQTV